MKTELFKCPQTLAEAMAWVNTKYPIEYAIREWLDNFYKSNNEKRKKIIAVEPPIVKDNHLNAWLGAIAEHLAREYRLPIPEWTQNPKRFLHSAWFVSKFESLKAMHIMESPTAFRKRMIFVSSDPLSRASKFKENE